MSFLSKKVQGFKQSFTRQLFDMAKGIPDAIDLTLGDPDVLPLEGIMDAACCAIRQGKTRYTQNAGLQECRLAIAKYNSQYYQMPITADEVFISCGGMGALFMLMSALLDSGDEVVIPAPCWPNYIQMVKLNGGVPVVVPTSEDAGFEITREVLTSAITSRTKAIVINNPCNPTGRCLSRETVDAIASLAVEKDVFVISDEVYRSLIYDANKHESLITRPGMRQRSAVVDSMSKKFSMTGYRLGYAIAPKELVSAMAKVQENVLACAPTPSQYAAIAAYGGLQTDETCKKVFAGRREVILRSLKLSKCLQPPQIQGTFYAFVNIGFMGMGSVEFAKKLLEDEHVAVVPGITYGEEYDNYVRIAFTVEESGLSEAMQRIVRFCDEKQKKGV